MGEHFGYDDAGWFTGLVEADSPNSTTSPPPLDSTTTTPGELRANWWKSAWTLLPFPAPVVPDSVWMWQAREELIERGLLDQVYAAIDEEFTDAIANRKARNRFEFDTRCNRSNALFQILRVRIGLSDQQLDELLISAAARQ